VTRYDYRLTVADALSAGKGDPRGNLRRVHEVVPGATLRGALAALWWTQADANQADFVELFDRRLRVSQAVPDGWWLGSAALKVCKYRSHDSLECATVQMDVAVYEAAGEDLPYAYCWVCGGPLDTQGGWRRAASAPAVGLDRRTRSALAPDETAADAQLFVREQLSARDGSFVLTGSIDLDGSIDWLDGKTIRIGGGKSLDLGRAVITLTKSDAAPEPVTGMGVVRTLSPTILLDAYGGPVVTAQAWETELRRVSGNDHLALESRPDWLRTEVVTGFHTRSRLPKPVDWAVAPGSCAIVRGLQPGDAEAFTHGVGYRTLEGYGAVEVSAPVVRVRPPEPEAVRRFNRLKQEASRHWPQVAGIVRKSVEDVLAGKPRDQVILAARTSLTRTPVGTGAQGMLQGLLELSDAHLGELKQGGQP